MTNVLRKLFAFLASYGFAVVLLFFLLVLTFLGTIAQANTSLYEVQKRYFESTFVVHHLYGVPIPLPGVYLLLILLFVNLVAGGVVRISKSWRTAGILVIHAGILLMLAAGLVEFQYSTKGHMTLFEGESSAEYQSYHEWEITIAEAVPSGEVTEHIIPGETFVYLDAGETATFRKDELPLELTVNRAFEHCEVRPTNQQLAADRPVVDGFALVPLPLTTKAEAHVAGLYVTVKDRESGATSDGILWGVAGRPLTVDAGGKRWHVKLDRKRWPVPFTIRLDDFRRELHPRTGMAKAFESDVIKVEEGVEQPILISMNNPLRHEGYTLFQASWGPENAGPNQRLFSTFAVVKNPADQWPLYSCIIMGVGLLLHFIRKLVRHVRVEAGRQA